MGHVLLINPDIDPASQNERIKAVINITFPTSVGFLASFLLKHNISAQINDEQLHRIDDGKLSELVLSLDSPRIIGISVLTLNSFRAYELCARIKKIDPEAVVILGGIHPTVLPEEPLSQPGVDLIVRGEGEKTLLEIVELIFAGKNYKKDVLGISYKKNGQIVHNPDRLFLQDLDQIPPLPYHMFEKDLERYPNFAVVYGSRGCPYGCTFCSARSMSGRKFRNHSVERIISDIKNLVRKYGQTSIHLIDDNIAVNKPHFHALCDAIIKEGLHNEASFQGSLRGDDASDEILKKAKEANFQIIYYGLETGSERLMKIINKGETVAEVVDAIRRAAKHGLLVGTTIIFGLPTETRKDRWDAMKLVRSLPLESARFNTLAPYPGTQVYKTLAPANKILIRKNWENFGVQYMWENDDIPYVPDGNDRLELIFDTMFANLSYYLNPHGIMKLLTQPVAGGNVIKLSNKWYFNVKEVWKFSRAFLYLAVRFLNVTIRMLLNRAKTNK
jgi:anaerobic magnesium-protoporphyrin IX monomethyl ester cyclase